MDRRATVPPPPFDDVELPDWPDPDGLEAESAAFKRALSRAASGLPTLLLLEAIDPADAASAVQVVSRPADPHVELIDLGPGAEAAYDPVALAAEHLGRNWSDRLYNVRIGEAGERVLPEWIGAIPGLGNLLAAVIMTVGRVRSRSSGPERPPAVRQILRSAQRRPVAIIARDLHEADRAGAGALCRLIRDAPVGARLLVVGSVRRSQQGDPLAPIHAGAGALPPERCIVHAVAPRTSEVLSALEGLAPGAASMVEAAAVIGEEFEGNELARVTGRDELETEDLLAVAVRQGIVKSLGLRDLEDGDITSVYRFVTPGLREAVLSRLPAGRRDELAARRAAPPT